MLSPAKREHFIALVEKLTEKQADSILPLLELLTANSGTDESWRDQPYDESKDEMIGFFESDANLSVNAKRILREEMGQRLLSRKQTENP